MEALRDVPAEGPVFMPVPLVWLRGRDEAQRAAREALLVQVNAGQYESEDE